MNTVIGEFSRILLGYAVELKEVIGDLELGEAKRLYIRDVSWHLGEEGLYSPLDIYLLEKEGVKTVKVYREPIVGVSTVGDSAFPWVLRSYGRRIGIEVLSLGTVNKPDLISKVHRASDIGIHVDQGFGSDGVLNLERLVVDNVFYVDRALAIKLLFGYIRPYISLYFGRPINILGPVLVVNKSTDRVELFSSEYDVVDDVDDAFYIGYPSDNRVFLEPLRSVAISRY